jgi:hypothetical protein
MTAPVFDLFARCKILNRRLAQIASKRFDFAATDERTPSRRATSSALRD